MRILLLRPDSGVFCVLPPLGLLSIAAYIREYSGHEVSIYDGVERCASDKQVLGAVESFQPDVVGISSMTCERVEGHHTAKIIKERFPKLTMVYGGSYASSQPDAVIENDAVDYVVIGEGEIPFLNLINALNSGGDPSSIGGVVSHNNGDSLSFSDRELLEDINSIPMPAWDLVDLERYFFNRRRPASMNIHVKSRRCVPISTTRGCPFECAYCHNIFGKRVRLRSVENVVEEIRYLKEEGGVEEIEFVDDIFNFDKNYALSLAQRIIDEGFNLYFSFSNGLRADLMTRGLVDKLVEMGTHRICYAIDSGCPEILEQIHRKLNLDKACDIIDYSASKDISVGLSLMLGFPGETEEQAKMTIDYAFKLKVATTSFLLLTPFPNSEIYEQAIRDKRISEYKVPHHFYALGNNLSNIPDKKLKRMMNASYRRFYLHPVRMWRFFRTTPIRYNFFHKTLALSHLFFHKFKMKKADRLDQYADGTWKRSRYS